MSTYSDQAKAYQEALKLGAINLEEVLIWADEVIANEDDPSIDFIELALSKKTSEAITYLNHLALNANEEVSFKILFGILHIGLINGLCSYQDVSKRLYFWSAYETNLSGYGDLLYFWDALDLAEAGHYGESGKVKTELLGFLNEHKA